MMNLKGFKNLVLVMLLLVVAQQAQALPLSTYANRVGNWQGSTFYDLPATGTNSGNMRGRIDYAVYDKLDTVGVEAAFVSSFNLILPQMEQYLYVYQIFNNINDPTDPAHNSDAQIASFAIFNIDKTVLDVASQNISEKEDDASSVQPSGSGLSADNKKVVWNFVTSTTTSAIVKGDHSWFLVLSSGEPVKGDYEMKSESDKPAPGPIPEPATVALLSAGGLFLARLRKRK